MRSALRKNKRVFQAGTWQRSQGRFRQAGELALNGYLGKITEIRVAVPARQYQPKYKGPSDPQPVPEGLDWAMWRGPASGKPFNPGRVAWPDWYLINDYCEGWTTNWGVHHLDIGHWGCPALGREPFEIECKGSYHTNKTFADNIETWKAVLTYPDGLRVVFTDITGQPAGTKFIGDKGWVHVNRRKIEASGNLLTVRPREGDVRLLPQGKEADDVFEQKIKGGRRVVYRTLSHAEGLLDGVRNRTEPISGIDATHVASTLGMVAGIAARLGSKLKWDWKDERFVAIRCDAPQRVSRKEIYKPCKINTFQSAEGEKGPWILGGKVVARDRIELSTRGFSVRIIALYTKTIDTLLYLCLPFTLCLAYRSDIKRKQAREVARHENSAGVSLQTGEDLLRRLEGKRQAVHAHHR